MSVFNSISVAVLIVLLAAGLITGLSISGVDILNPQTAKAEANRMIVETNHQATMYEQEERLAATETNARIQTIEREQDIAEAQAKYEKEMLALDLRKKEHSAATWSLLVTWFGGAMSIAIIISSVLWVGSKAIVIVKSTPINTTNNWSAALVAQTNRRRPSPDAFKARQRERVERARAIQEKQELTERFNRILRESAEMWPQDEESEDLESGDYPWAK